MDEKERFSFYEKIYFYEMDRKEKLISRLNLPLAMMVAVASFLSYMLNKAPTTQDGPSGVFFWIFYLFTILLLLCGARYFWSSWQLKDYDKGLPTLIELEKYRESSNLHFKTYGKNPDDGDTYFRLVIQNYYIEGAATNTANNDKRTEYLGSLASYVTLTIILALCSFLPFYIHHHPEVSPNERSETTATATAATNEICEK
ncbi:MULTISPECIES: hypothetical protein [unclassified Pseudomonas]|jgi:hypothetical protein|uniref:Uncharacterized protein n=2 Tax=Pseudomonas TaxID=286 RepID=A0ACA7NZ29_9PSED|nr:MULTISPECIES: hypothetical protein [unclassified Pseudomonas]AHC32933.1 hypothetical protein U771_01865 [Pseudomonas sp. TKP]MBL1308046.1 hypothetical protein [Pseudomonas sp.]PMX16231.1 hypothetical protein C1Y25_09145 [Pseudomonas sp. MPBC4-3]PMX48985.1 hypothetical protein C1Y20_08190 [Pseudomonas sp. FW301-21B01]PNA71678.1 hypothetical protein C1Y14_04685 [Pseudomonas sp. MPR-R5B]